MNATDKKSNKQIDDLFVDFNEKKSLSSKTTQPLSLQNMYSERYFQASWGQQLKAITAGISCLLAGISVYSLWLILNGSASTSVLTALLPLAIVIISSLFTVRGYSISGNQLIIHRLGWSNNIDLSGLSSATHIPGAMQGSFRTFANGGLFAFAGNFHSNDLGAYRAYATNNMNSVVLKFANNAVVIVSPDEPDEFVKIISASKF